MKKLFDSKQYKKALDVFHEQSESRTDVSINIALKSCTMLRNYEYGKIIRQQLSSHSLNNKFIQTSLIQFYSELFLLCLTHY
jgi:hypothetical protein